MKRILVLGANGFIGSHLASHLATHSKISLSLFSRGFSAATAQLASKHKIKLFKGDFQNTACLRKVLEGQEIVYHLISETFPASSWHTPVSDVEKNLLPTLRFLKAAGSAGVKKIAFVSSGGTVYGHTGGVLDENALPRPFSPHGIIKLCIEHFLNYASVKYGLAFDIYRVANPYGPDQNTKGLGVIAAWLRRILNNEEIIIYGNGKVVRDFIYIKDVIRLLALSTVKSVSHSDVYNISTGKGVSLNQLAAELRRVIPRSFRVVHMPARQSDNSLAVLNNSKIMKKFPGLKLQSLGEGLLKTWDALC